jgi:8-oxo-dGTP pyrophosphatase MutT (NUDIX family)
MEQFWNAAEFGRVIRAERKRKEFTQAELAAHSDVGATFVSHLENGKASSELGKALRVGQASGLDFFAKRRDESAQDHALVEDHGRWALHADIAAYRPFNEQEAADRQIILRALETDPGCFDRSAQAHLACSVWTVDPTFERTLLVYHNIYDSWSWIGGHADGERDLAAVALRELEEETGVHGRLLPCGKSDGAAGMASGAEERRRLADGDARERPAFVYSLEVLTVDGHEKRGAYVSSHLHLNVTYLAVADPREPLRTKPDENSGVRWVPLEDAVRLSTEPWIRDRVYRKLIDKLASVERPAP